MRRQIVLHAPEATAAAALVLVYLKKYRVTKALRITKVESN